MIINTNSININYDCTNVLLTYQIYQIKFKSITYFTRNSYVILSNSLINNILLFYFFKTVMSVQRDIIFCSPLDRFRKW